MNSPIVEALREEVSGRSATELEVARRRVSADVDAIHEEMKERVDFGFLARKPEPISADDHVGPPKYGAGITIVQGSHSWKLRNIGIGLLIQSDNDASDMNIRILIKILADRSTKPEVEPEVVVERIDHPQVIKVGEVRYSVDRGDGLLICNITDPGGPISAELFEYLANI